MHHRYASIAVLLILLGAVLVVYGFGVGNQALYSLDVEDAVNASNLQGDTDVIEYDYLEPDMQDAFRGALRTDDRVRLSEKPDFQVVYVHYRDVYYLTEVGVADASQATMVFSIAGGLVLIVLGAIGWYLSRGESSGGLLTTLR